MTHVTAPGTWIASLLVCLLLLPAPILALTGAVLGYELTHAPEPASQASASVRLQPLLGLSSRGAMQGLGGSF